MDLKQTLDQVESAPTAVEALRRLASQSWPANRLFDLAEALRHVASRAERECSF